MTAPAMPVASYRLQLGPDLGFERAAGLLDHLARLGISHVYLSPVTEAVPGSTHGYDVVDHTRVRAELGGEEGLIALMDAAASRGLGLIVDHVPNHVSVAVPASTPRWWGVLRDGPQSPDARWFDVDWDSAEGRVVLPVMGTTVTEALENGQLAIDGDALVVHGDLRLPLAAGTAGLPLDELVELQHYVLTWWRAPERNVRRFFTIDDLVGVRVEDPDVQAAVDTVPRQLRDHAAFAGVRVDHVDGLADPLGYLRRLRETVGEGALVLVEKILAPAESLPQGWPVQGTTGYEMARAVDHLLLDPEAEPLLDRSWQRTGGPARFHEVAAASRREVLGGALRPDLERTVRAVERAVTARQPAAAAAVASAVLELSVALPRYRTYLPDDPAGAATLAATADAVRERVADPAVLDAVVGVLLHGASDDERAARTRWQQLTGPATAKGEEDRAFYRYVRWAALSEVGGDPAAFASSPSDAHAELAHLAEHSPTSMVAASTHDTKRSGDVRARSTALTWFAHEWVPWHDARLDELVAAGHDAVDVTLALQTAATCREVDPDRLAAFLVKSAREAERGTSWTDPDDAVEVRLGRLASDVLTSDGLGEWCERLDPPGARASVAAMVLRFTMPGFPDVYQGTETLTYRLVDPDNRAQPDWDALRDVVERAERSDVPRALVGDPPAAKAAVILRLAALRRRRAAAFGPDADYVPLAVHDAAARTPVLAFCRAGHVVTVVGTSPIEPPRGHVQLPAGAWVDVLREVPTAVSGRVEVAELVGDTGAAVLERVS